MLGALMRTILLVVLLIPVRAWAWGDDGHEIAAVIAADNLTPAAQSHVASVLGVPTDKIAAAMEAASIRPDSEFREEDPSTKPGTSSTSVCWIRASTFRVDVPPATA
jgi:hypothetical protein